MTISPSVRGLLWMLAQTTSMCAMMTAVRHLSFDGFSGPQLVFFRGIMGLMVLLPWLLHTIRYEPKILAPPQWKFVMWRSLISVVGILCWFLALTGMSVSDVTAVQFTHPLFVVVGAALLLRENVGAWRWSAVLIGFLGALVIIRPGYMPFKPADPGDSGVGDVECLGPADHQACCAEYQRGGVDLLYEFGTRAGRVDPGNP